MSTVAKVSLGEGSHFWWCHAKLYRGQDLKTWNNFCFLCGRKDFLNRNSTYKAFRTVVWNLSVRQSYLLKMQTSRPHPEIGIQQFGIGSRNQNLSQAFLRHPVLIQWLSATLRKTWFQDFVNLCTKAAHPFVFSDVLPLQGPSLKLYHCSHEVGVLSCLLPRQG